jgi:signal transduction histidine kinase
MPRRLVVSRGLYARGTPCSARRHVQHLLRPGFLEDCGVEASNRLRHLLEQIDKVEQARFEVLLLSPPPEV